jgi:hypothetical protein
VPLCFEQIEKERGREREGMRDGTKSKEKNQFE